MSYACTTGTQVIESLLDNSKNRAVGWEAKTITQMIYTSLEDYFVPVSRENIPIIKFSRLKEQWKEGTSFLSSIHDIVLHPQYQQIIGMGEVVVPFILSEMRKKPDLWFWALRAITGEEPVKEEHYGKIVEMTQDWVEWGINRGII